MDIVDQYSGIVINQNQKPAETSDFIALNDNLWRYQEVFLPNNYVRGSQAGKQIIPPLSGWQLLVGVDTGTQATASLEWIAQYRIFGVGWITLATGITTGIHAEGDQVWMDMPFNDPVDMNLDLIEERMRFGFRKISGVNKVWYSNPNPLALQGFARLYAADGITPIQDTGADLSVLFRVLGLTVDNGTDFLGNSYRSALRSNVSDNTNTVDGAKIDSIYMSEPSPSRFAVKSLYYDVRTPTPIRYGAYNLVEDPSFESSVTGWDENAYGGTLTRENGWSSVGSWAGRYDRTGTGYGGIVSLPPGGFPVVGNQAYSAQAKLNISFNPQGIRFLFNWKTIAGAAISTDYGNVGSVSTGLTGVRTIQFLNVVAPTNAAFVQIEIASLAAMIVTDHLQFYVDEVILLKGTTIPGYFDGDMPGYRWARNPHASASVEVFEGTIADDECVIDNVLVDPVTPGVWFSIYYSNEGDRPSTEEDWENKLWTKVPGSYLATKRESHKLPQPILAKFIKIEFTHLQARSYNPGDFAKPVSYKKHPKWVLDYFLARVAAEQELSDQLSAGRVAVIYDALDIAYNYYLDDLKQEPDQPVEVDSSYTDFVQNFLSDHSDLSDVVDAAVLEQINLAMKPYRDKPNTFAKSDYLPSVISQTVASDEDYPTERNNIPRNEISTLRNTEVVQENDYPVMFFYLTCRHKYREVLAPFSHDRAYFVGIREIAFTRENYAIAFDNTQYIEPSGDLFNTERNDFVQSGDGIMSI